MHAFKYSCAARKLAAAASTVKMRELPGQTDSVGGDVSMGPLSALVTCPSLLPPSIALMASALSPLSACSGSCPMR